MTIVNKGNLNEDENDDEFFTYIILGWFINTIVKNINIENSNELDNELENSNSNEKNEKMSTNM